ncbi:MAG: helix-turn-helix domain-containing protein [Clostridia bacterium]|nr:helix-turn-helix domain-containing protein [Clostridia bacterium]
MDLGEKLYELRRTKNLSQENVAEQLNVTRQTISKWETNQSTPDFDKIVPLCELYGITPNELLTGEKPEEKNNNIEGKENNIKKNLFFRGKDDDYENMTRNQIKRKSAEVISGSVFLFIFAIAFVGVGDTVLRWNSALVGCTFLLLIGLGVTNIIRHFMSIPKFKKTEDEKKEDEILNQINGIIGAICVVIYFIVSFTTFAWHITWVIFIINGLICQIIKLLFMLKEDRKNEK